MKNFLRLIALVLCVALLPLTALTAMAAEEDLNDGVTRIALLISGDLGDMSFWDSAYAGLTKFAEDHPEVVVDIIEMGSSDTSKYESTLTKVCNGPYDLIIVGSTDMREPLQRAAKKKKYADRRFIIFDTEIKDGKAADYPTVHSIMFNQNEGGYLAGTLAALLTLEKGAANTAFIGGTKNDIINDFGYGFMQGVRDVNAAKGVNVGAYNAYIGDFVNSPKGSSLATSFYESGVEVLFAAASQAGLGCIDSAKNNSKLIIGVDSDQYAYYAETDPEKAAHIVTSVLKRVDLALYNCCEQFLNGTLTYGDLEVLGVAEGMIGLVENDNYNTLVPEEIRAYVSDVAAQIADGTLVVESGLKRYTKQDALNELFDALDPTK
nr:BMP family ABC transporter substrate-binding protein [Clostridia bacterium]